MKYIGIYSLFDEIVMTNVILCDDNPKDLEYYKCLINKLWNIIERFDIYSCVHWQHRSYTNPMSLFILNIFRKKKIFKSNFSRKSTIDNHWRFI